MDHAVAPHLVAQFTRLARLAALASSTGLPRAFASAFGDAIGLPEPARSEKIQTFADPAHTRWAAAEVGCWRTDAEQARSAGPLDADLPVAVVLTGSPDGALRRHAIQTAPAHDSSAGFVLHAPGADHASLLGERYAHVIVRALLAVEAASKA
jgi:hypothetical protein